MKYRHVPPRFEYPEEFFMELEDHEIDQLMVGWYKDEVKPEVVEWLDQHTPSWRLLSFKIIRTLVFQTREHALLFKLTWGQ